MEFYKLILSFAIKFPQIYVLILHYPTKFSGLNSQLIGIILINLNYKIFIVNELL